MTKRIQEYYAKIDQRDVEVAANEGLTLEEWDKKEMERKRKEDREWNKRDAILKGLRKPKASQRKMILVEELEDAKSITESNSLIVEPENVDTVMAETTAMPEPNKNMAGKATEPELNVEMVVNTPMLEPNLKSKRLKKMTIK